MAMCDQLFLSCLQTEIKEPLYNSNNGKSFSLMALMFIWQKQNLTLLSSMVLLQYAFVIDLFYMRILATPSSRPAGSLNENLQSVP